MSDANSLKLSALSDSVVEMHPSNSEIRFNIENASSMLLFEYTAPKETQNINCKFTTKLFNLKNFDPLSQRLHKHIDSSRNVLEKCSRISPARPIKTQFRSVHDKP